MMKELKYCIFSAIALLLSLTGCIEDGITTSPSHQPRYSVDTLALGTLFTAEPTPTYSFKIFNPHDKAQ